MGSLAPLIVAPVIVGPAITAPATVAPSWASPARVAVPDAVKPALRLYASWWRQWGAAAVDGLGALAAVAASVRLALFVLDIKATPQGLVDALHANIFSVLPVVLAIAVGIAGWHLTAIVFGATPGQRLFGLRLVDGRGHRPALPRLVIRALVNGVFGATFLISPLWALLLDGRRRGFGDIVAGTVAIHR